MTTAAWCAWAWTCACLFWLSACAEMLLGRPRLPRPRPLPCPDDGYPGDHANWMRTTSVRSREWSRRAARRAGRAGPGARPGAAAVSALGPPLVSWQAGADGHLYARVRGADTDGRGRQADLVIGPLGRPGRAHANWMRTTTFGPLRDGTVLAAGERVVPPSPPGQRACRARGAGPHIEVPESGLCYLCGARCR